MIVWPGLRRSFGLRGGIPIANSVAHFDAYSGITAAADRISQWSDQSGLAHHLLQASGANQPIHLPFSGEKYGWLPGVAGNYFSTPDSVAASITGDIDIRVKAALTDWTPSAVTHLIAKDGGGGQISYNLMVDTSGNASFRKTGDGTATHTATSSVSLGFVDGATHWMRASYASGTGKVNFYTSTDGVTWVPLGAEQTITAGDIFNSTATLDLGARNFGSGGMVSGKIFSAQIYNGIDGTLAVDFDPSRWTSGTTFTASTGETWTINSTGSKPAQIVDRPSLLFDGSAHFLKTAAFTLNQPETVYLVAKQVTWTSTDSLFDGNSVNTGQLIQTTSSPRVSINAGASVAENSDMTLATNKVLCAVFNGASSLIQVGTASATTGDAGAGNMGGFTLGAAGSNLLFGNLQAHEALIYNVAHDAATRANVIRALMTKWGVS